MLAAILASVMVMNGTSGTSSEPLQFNILLIRVYTVAVSLPGNRNPETVADLGVLECTLLKTKNIMGWGDYSVGRAFAVSA